MKIDVLPEQWGQIPQGIPIFGGMPIYNSMVTGMGVSVLLIVLALIVRLFLLKRFSDRPKGSQNIIELVVEAMQNYTNSKVGEKAGEPLGPYMFTLAAYIGLNGLTEYVGLGRLRPAPTDINQTVTFALVTFVLIRVFGYRKKGAWGRIKSAFLQPVAAIAPIKLVVEMAVPVSLACRMFGNLLGGVVIMALLYQVVPFVVPAFASTFFTLFHTGMQAFIFITLSLAFIEEALE